MNATGIDAINGIRSVWHALPYIAIVCLITAAIGFLIYAYYAYLYRKKGEKRW